MCGFVSSAPLRLDAADSLHLSDVSVSCASHATYASEVAASF